MKRTTLPLKGMQVLVIDPKSMYFGKVMTTLSDPIRLSPDQCRESSETAFKPGDVVNDLEVDLDGKGVKYWLAALSHLLVPIPPPAKAKRMFGKEDLGVAA